ncbi:Sedlin [Pseudomassariella vexata]|uniref:Sedlin n=1 Tax=Pseudomassariella vexata TaxID=1141098 RepID=A0A1Y2DK33_9PEZI|nr:Sedlin [Pseudomassariella vexata]ORY59617.1 Sedlin [Pseudomassariella vexata]
MATAVPSIACLGIIGRNNKPLHTTIIPTSTDAQTGSPIPLRTPLQFSLLLSSTLDIFESRARHASSSNTLLSGDFGLLHAVDERLAAYGYETNTGVKFVVVVDMRGRMLDLSSKTGGVGAAGGGGGTGGTGVGLREGELKVVFRAMQTAYVRLLQNPFYDPDEHEGRGGKRITSRKFAQEMRRIGELWVPGSATLG